MKRISKLFKIVISLMVAVPLLISTPASAGIVDLPPQAEGLVDEDDILEMVKLMAYARSAEVLGYLDALNEVLPPLMAMVRQELGDGTPALTDVAALRTRYINRLQAIENAGSIANAEQIVATLEVEARALEGTLRGLQGEMQKLEPLLRSRAATIEAEIRAQIETEVQAKVVEANAELNALGEAKGADAENAARAQASAAAGSYSAADCDSGCQAELQAKLDAYIAEKKKQITAEMNTLAAQKEEEIRDWAEKRAYQLKGEQIDRFQQIQEQFANVSARIESIAAERIAQYKSYYNEFLNKKRQIVEKAMAPQYDAAIAMIRQHKAELDLAAQEGRGDVPTMDALIQEFTEGWQGLADTIADAEYPEDIDEAIEGFKAIWQIKQQQLEMVRNQGTEELVRITLEKLNEHDTIARLTEAQPELAALIVELESQASLSQDAESKLRLTREILPLIDDALEMIEVFEGDVPVDDITELFELRNRLQERLADIAGLADRIDSIDLPGNGIYIEAEHESFTDLLPNEATWHSHEELNYPSWRPPLSNGGLWYFSRAPETLGYYFTVEREGDYTIWLRDLASLDWPAGARKVHIVVDGKDYGAFSEHSQRTRYPQGTMDWHTTATVHLTKGQHTLELKKLETTGAGPLIDAIYITDSKGDDPRTMVIE